jgi:glycine cleavage system H protein
MMADDLSRRGFFKESSKAIFGNTISAINDSAQTEKPSSKPALSPGGLSIFYDEIHPYGYIIAPGTEFKIPMDRRYSIEHTWIKVLPGNKAQAGITECVPPLLNAITAVDLPEKGDEVFANRCFGSLEGGKVNIDLISPLHGEIIESNIVIVKNPGKLHTDPYDDGWLILFQISNPKEMETLLTPDRYAAAVAT